jgi:hypothetical protein
MEGCLGPNEVIAVRLCLRLQLSQTENREIELRAQIEVLLQLEYTIAYTGSLENLQQKSYVLFSDITKVLNEKRSELAKIKKSLPR